MANRTVTVDAENDDKVPSAFDKVMLIDVSTSPDSLKEAYVSSLAFLRYKLSVTVSASDLIVALKHLDDSDPSSTAPLYFRIGSSIRAVTAALSITIADGTNWFNAGAAELGTLAVPYFVYAVWDSNSSVVALSIARIPYGRLVSDFSATTTNEKHLYNYANFTSTDDVVNIGYFEAILSLTGTSHLWTVPTFTSSNLRHEPTFVSQYMTWTPGHTGYSTPPTTNNSYTYVVNQREVRLYYLDGTGSTSSLTTYTATAPFSPSVTAHGLLAQTVDNSASSTTPGRVFVSSGASTMTFHTNTATGAWTASGQKRAVIMGLILVL